jgi:hypothetical protein
VGYKNKYDQVAFQKEWYRKNKEKIKKRHALYRKEHKPTIQTWLSEYKKTLSCIQCGENFPPCLQFHHRDRSTKRFSISAAARMCVCIDEILKEIEQCDVLCANCHTKRHYGETGREDMRQNVALVLHRFESDVSPQYKFDW